MSYPICYILTNIISYNKPRSIKNLFLFWRGTHTKHQVFWKEPEGYDTGITVYNALSKSKVPFRTLYPGIVTWYNCGPTVYDSAHIGHALCYVKLDIIRRILQDVFHLNVVQVLGITDIDDKIIKRAKELNVSVKNLTQKYEEEFFEDMKKLNVLPPSVTPRVTDHIPQILSFVEKLMKKGYAYDVGEGTVYFDTSSYGRYGKFKTYEKEMNRISSDGRKKSSKDFALWKGTKDKNSLMWDSPWGPGRPGWHIECSAIASQIFGEKLDLHSGGMDLMFPHHENEEAQCCAHHSCEQWCNYWIHIGHLHLKDNTKMSKSLKNTITIENYLHDYSSNVFRLFCLFSHYRSIVDYEADSMVSSLAALKKITSFFLDSQAYISGISLCGPLNDSLILQKFAEVKNGIHACLADNFNTKDAMLLLLQLISVCNKELNNNQKRVKVGRSYGTILAVCGYVEQFLTSLGLKFDSNSLLGNEFVNKDQMLVNIVDSSLRFRQRVKNFALLKDVKENEILSNDEKKKLKLERIQLLKDCDQMREEFNEIGLQINEYAGAASWTFQKKKSECVKAITKEDKERK